MRRNPDRRNRILRSLIARCEYGYTPPLKVVAVDAGLSVLGHGTVLRYFNQLIKAGLVERKGLCYRPTQAALDQYEAEIADEERRARARLESRRACAEAGLDWRSVGL